MVDLSNNQLSGLPIEILELTSLEELYMIGNPLVGKFNALKQSQNCKGNKL